MIVNKNKNYFRNSAVLSENIMTWPVKETYLVDESTPEGKALADKIERLWPYINLVVKNDTLIDVVDLTVKVACPDSASIGENVNLFIECCEQSADIAILADIDGTDYTVSDKVDLYDGSGSATLSFDDVGEYTISVTTEQHGTALMKVVVT